MPRLIGLHYYLHQYHKLLIVLSDILTLYMFRTTREYTPFANMLSHSRLAGKPSAVHAHTPLEAAPAEPELS